MGVIAEGVNYELLSEGDERGIRCKLCGQTSWNPNDVTQLFCGSCKLYLDEYAVITVQAGMRAMAPDMTNDDVLQLTKLLMASIQLRRSGKKAG